MQDINYQSLQAKTADTSKDPWIAMSLGLAAIVFIVGIVLLFSEYLAMIEYIVTLVGFLLFFVFIVLIYYIIYDVQLKRNKLLRAFARDNNFDYRCTPPIFGNDYIPEYIGSSLLLSAVRRFSYRVTPRSNMSLRGTYNGVDFLITIVGMYWSRPQNKSGVSFFQTVIVHSESLRTLPHLIALSKSSDRIFSALNGDVVKSQEWHPVSLGWEARATYDMYSSGILKASEYPAISRAMAHIHAVDESDIEIVNSDIYIIKIDGIDFTKEGFEPIFQKISIIANVVNGV